MSMIASSSGNIAYTQLFSGKKLKRMINDTDPHSLVNREGIVEYVSEVVSSAKKRRLEEEGNVDENHLELQDGGGKLTHVVDSQAVWEQGAGETKLTDATGAGSLTTTVDASGVATIDSSGEKVIINNNLELQNGNMVFTGDVNAQITLGFGDSELFPQFISTSSDDSSLDGNTIKLWTGDKTENGVFPTNAILGLTVANGQCKQANAPVAGEDLCNKTYVDGGYGERLYNRGKYGATLNESGVTDSIKTTALGGTSVLTECRGLAWNGKYFMATSFQPLPGAVHFFDHQGNPVKDEFGNTSRPLTGAVHGAVWDGSLLWVVSPYNNANILAFNMSGPTVITECTFDIPGNPQVHNIGYAEGLLYVVTNSYMTDRRMICYRWEGGNNMTEIFNIDVNPYPSADPPVIGMTAVQGITYDGEHLWLCGSDIYRCDLDGTNIVTIPISAIEGNPYYGGWVWTGKNIVALNFISNILVALNVEKNTVYADKLEVKGAVQGVAFNTNNNYVSGLKNGQPLPDSVIQTIPPTAVSVKVSQMSSSSLGASIRDIAWNGQHYLVTDTSGSVYLFDSELNPVTDKFGRTSIDLTGSSSTNGAAWDGSIFWCISHDHILTGWDLSTNPVTQVASYSFDALPNVTQAVGYAEGLLYLFHDTTTLKGLKWDGTMNGFSVVINTTLALAFSYVNGIAYDGRHLYCQNYSGELRQFKLDGSVVQTWNGTQFQFFSAPTLAGLTWNGENLVCANIASSGSGLYAIHRSKEIFASTVVQDRLSVNGQTVTSDIVLTSTGIQFPNLPSFPASAFEGTLIFKGGQFQYYDGTTWNAL